MTFSRRRQFHASTSSKARTKGFPSIKASDPQLRPYTPREKQLLALKYTPEQMKVIKAGESAIPAEDLQRQGRMRTDPMRIPYIDDFATMRPVLDRPLEAEDLKEQDRLIEGANKFGKENKQALAASEQAETEESDPHMLRLCQQTGLTRDEIRRVRIKNLVCHRVVNQTRMGKIQSLYYLTIAGNQNGMVGIGEGKAVEDEDGRRQAMMNAIRNMKPIPRYEERTIYGDVQGKVGATVVQLSSRPPGMLSLLLFFCHAHWLTSLPSRLRQSLSTSGLRAGTRRRYQRSRRPNATLTQQDERCQGRFSGFDEPTTTRRCGARARKEDGGREKCVLWRPSLINMVSAPSSRACSHRDGPAFRSLHVHPVRARHAVGRCTPL